MDDRAIFTQAAREALTDPRCLSALGQGRVWRSYYRFRQPLVRPRDADPNALIEDCKIIVLRAEYRDAIYSWMVQGRWEEANAAWIDLFTGRFE